MSLKCQYEEIVLRGSEAIANILKIEGIPFVLSFQGPREVVPTFQTATRELAVKSALTPSIADQESRTPSPGSRRLTLTTPHS